MSLKHFLTWYLAVLLCGIAPYHKANGQQTPQFTQYYLHEPLYNPAAAGKQRGLNATLSIRAQWIGIEGLPRTQTLSTHAPVPLLRGSVGFALVNDQLGAQQNIELKTMYAYRQNIARKRYLQVGLAAGLRYKGLKTEQLITPEGDYVDGNINHEDNLIAVKAQNALAPDLSIGIYYQHSEKLNIGVALQQLLGNAFKIQGSEPDTEVNIKMVQHLSVNAAYRIDIGQHLALLPSVLLYSDFNKWQTNITLPLHINQRFYIGTALRGLPTDMESASIVGGWQFNPQWLISYSYDIVLNELNSATSGSHELTLQYHLDKIIRTKQGKIRYSPRFL